MKAKGRNPRPARPDRGSLPRRRLFVVLIYFVSRLDFIHILQPLVKLLDGLYA